MYGPQIGIYCYSVALAQIECETDLHGHGLPHKLWHCVTDCGAVIFLDSDFVRVLLDDAFI